MSDIKIKGLTDEDFLNYKKPSMFVAFPHCTFKCEKECGIRCCQNSALATAPEISVDPKALAKRYVENRITSAIVIGGLEPLDDWEQLKDLMSAIRELTQDDIVVYTGYREDEVAGRVEELSKYRNVIVKFGRFRPNQKPHHDEVLGVDLASDGQYAKRL